MWFHTKDIHGSHAVLLLDKEKISDENILIKCAQIVAYHSKARNSTNVPGDFCEVKYVKKPNGAKPGMVIYSNNKTLYVNPKWTLGTVFKVHVRKFFKRVKFMEKFLKIHSF